MAAELKRSNGLPVRDLAERLGMSYMGVKAQCLALEESGFLSSRNVHHGTGRPQLVYRLSARGQKLFQTDDNRLAIDLLKEAQALFGPTSAEKLLYQFFQKRGAEYARKIPTEKPLEAKLAALAALREAEGCMPRVEGETLVESHCPLSGIFEAFPAASSMEEAVVSKALGLKVRRHVLATGDHYEIRFEAFRCEGDAG
ncbi:MAG: hypothetical protein D4R65_06060 [Verrucomicrobiaceae bacterium]|nr:MAG: hypothetical protein D4R65_06060 [Verrucomicrobiaceae bacterium]